MIHISACADKPGWVSITRPADIALEFYRLIHLLPPRTRRFRGGRWTIAKKCEARLCELLEDAGLDLCECWDGYVCEATR